MIRKLLLVISWFPLTLALLILNLTLLSQYQQTGHELNAQISPQTQFQLTASSGTAQVLSATVDAGDARVLLIQAFLRQHNSPMTTYAQQIVEEADANGVDFRMVPAIAMCESNVGKRMPKKDEYNAWGIAVYTGTNTGKGFADWPTAIRWVTKYIKQNYHDRGLTSLYDIGAIWAPPSVENGYSWTNCVQRFMDKII